MNSLRRTFAPLSRPARPADAMPADTMLADAALVPGAVLAATLFLASGPAAQVVLRVDLGPAPGASAGRDLATIDDVDMDGVSDYAVGAPLYDQPLVFGAVIEDHGRVEVRSGATGDLLYAYSPPGTSLAGANFGRVVEGELGAAGLFAVGAPFEEVGGSERGRARVFRPGVFGGVMEGLVFEGVATDEELGTAVLGLPDVTGDGIADIAVGGPGVDFVLPFSPPVLNVGGVRVYSGLNGAQVVQLLGGVEHGRFGSRLARVADYDGDGKRDFAASAPGFGLGGEPGYVRIVSCDGAFTPLATFTGPSEAYGTTLLDLGDVDGGGQPDLLIGGAALTSSGRLEVRRGEDGSVLWSQTGTSFDFGHPSAIGDFDGDGVRELAVADGNSRVLRFLDPATGAESTSIASVFYPRREGMDVLPDPLVAADRLLCGAAELENLAGGVLLLDPLAPAPGPSVVDVDAAGGGDFESLGVAAVMSGAGSTYLVSPGTYADVHFEKAATVIGSSALGVELGDVRVEDAQRFTLSRVTLGKLSATDVSGRMTVSDCTALGATSVVLECPDVLFQNTTLWPQLAFDDEGAIGLFASSGENGYLQVVSCDVRGGDGDDSTGLAGPDPGGVGIQSSGYQLLVVRSLVRGGDAGTLMQGQSAVLGESGGPAIRSLSGSVDFRGGDVPGGLDGGAGSLASGDAVDVELDFGATFVGSGLDFFDVPSTNAPGATTYLFGGRPMLGLTGDVTPGGQLSFEVLDDAGTPGVLLLSLGTAVLPLPDLQTVPLFCDLGSLVTTFAVGGLGFGTPSELSVPIASNPALIGLELCGQVAMVTLGAYEGSNVIQAVIGS